MTGKSRDLAGKIAGVSGRRILSAKKVETPGIQPLKDMVLDGSVPASSAERLAAADADEVRELCLKRGAVHRVESDRGAAMMPVYCPKCCSALS
ncbi:MAG: hypothetical protein KDA61_13350, partial [Planctomycetales bacterium]|nr:hypothetical protein [Planctomycetales bacterium]